MHVSEQLRQMREEAGYSRDELARAIGFRTGSALQRYENPEEYRRPWLRVDLVARLLPPLTARGIAKARVWALAGVPDPDAPQPDPPPGGDLIPADLVAVAVAALHKISDRQIGDRITLSPAEAGELVVSFCRLYADEVAVGSLPAIPDTEQAVALLRLFQRGRMG